MIKDLIEGEKVYLRPICSSDTNNIIRWRNNIKVRSNFIYQEDLTAEIHKKWLKEFVIPKYVIQYIIVDKKTKKDIGSIYYNHIDYENGIAEYGIFIGDNKYRGKGLGTEAGKIFLNYGFINLNLKKNLFTSI